MQYFFRHELPEINHWSKIICDLDTTVFDMQAEWF
jgi:butyryl-CoA dehydrogenase